MIDRQIEKLKLGKVHRHNILWSSCEKFYPTGLEVMEKWLRKDGQMDGRVHEAATIYICACLSGRITSHRSYRNLLKNPSQICVNPTKDIASQWMKQCWKPYTKYNSEVFLTPNAFIVWKRENTVQQHFHLCLEVILNDGFPLFFTLKTTGIFRHNLCRNYTRFQKKKKCTF